MYDLMSYKEARIEALLKRINELELRNEQLTTYVFELCDEECPTDYKRIVRTEVFKNGE